MKSEYERAKYIIHHSVSSFDVAKAIGLSVNEYGRMNQCPVCKHSGSGGFIANKNGTDRNGNYYCFYGQHGGDCIDLVMKYYGYSYTEAVNWIIDQFRLNLPKQSDLTTSEQTERSKEQKMRDTFLVLYDGFIKLYYKVMKNQQKELIAESDDLLENVKKIIRSLS